MPRIHYSGPLAHRIASTLALYRISLATVARHALGRRLDPGWGLAHEIGIRFWRHQFTRAMTMDDIAMGRAYFDSLQTGTGEVHAVTRERVQTPVAGTWITPDRITSPATLLYFHGGGYTFDARMTDDFADLIAARTGARLFKPDYRLTPDHRHPAQAEDALVAYRAILGEADPARLVVLGDSAGGHMALMLLLAARDTGLPQPALCIGLSPWTDIGARGASLTANDRYDIVSGWMALRFGEWLTGGDVAAHRTALSPVFHDFSGLCPLYLQGGGKEVLIDMIRDFADLQAKNGARICFDCWDNMTHDFFGYGNTRPEAEAALERMREVIEAAIEGRPLPAGATTVSPAP